jgi:hypothetical protein
MDAVPLAGRAGHVLDDPAQFGPRWIRWRTGGSGRWYDKSGEQHRSTGQKSSEHGAVS